MFCTPRSRTLRHPLTEMHQMVRGVLAVIACAGLFAACSSPSGTNAVGSDRSADGANAKGPVKIGVVAAFSGPLASVGNAVLGGARFAVDARNDTGGLGGRNVELVRCDGAFEVSKERTCLEKLVAEDHVDAIVMDDPSLVLLQPKTVADAQVPVLLPVAGPDKIDVARLANVFSLRTDRSSTKVLATSLARTNPGAKVGILSVDNPVAASGGADLGAELVKAGMPQPVRETFAAGQADVSAQARKLRDAGATVLVPVALGADSAKVVKAAHDLGWSPQIAGLETLYMRAYRELLGSMSNDTLLTLPHAGDVDTIDISYARWLVDFYSRYGIKLLSIGGDHAPDYPGLELPAYELTTAVLDAIERAPSRHDARGTVQALEASQPPFKPVARSFAWTPNEHVATPDPSSEVWLARFTNGHVDFSPDPRSVPGLEAARIATESWLFRDGTLPKADASTGLALLEQWKQQVTARQGEIVAKAGQARYDAVIARTDQAIAALKGTVPAAS